MTFYPIRAVSAKTGKECFSFIGVPDCAKGKFLPQKAKQLGCVPNLHFKLLSDSQSVTLDNGDVIFPEMVTDKQLPSHAFALVFLPDEDYIESFLKDNQPLFNRF